MFGHNKFKPTIDGAFQPFPKFSYWVAAEPLKLPIEIWDNRAMRPSLDIFLEQFPASVPKKPSIRIEYKLIKLHLVARRHALFTPAAL